MSLLDALPIPGSAIMVDLPRTCSGVWKLTEDHPLGRLGSASSVDGKRILEVSACIFWGPGQ